MIRRVAFLSMLGNQYSYFLRFAGNRNGELDIYIHNRTRHNFHRKERYRAKKQPELKASDEIEASSNLPGQ